MRHPEPNRIDPTLNLTGEQRERYEANRVVYWNIYKATIDALAGKHWSVAETAAAAARSQYLADCAAAYRDIVHGLGPSEVRFAA
jgi:hypothetical protein